MAERVLNNILSDINNTIKNTVSFGSKITAWGNCYLQEKDEKTFPLLNTGGRQGTKISWDDKYPLQIYHRIIDVEKDVDTDKGYGGKPYEERIYTMRLVGIGSKEKLGTTTYEDNQDYCNDVSDAIPRFISSTEYAEVTDHQVIKQEVYDSEFAGVDHQKVLSLEGIAFWIEYTLRVQACDATPTSPTNLVATAGTSDISLSWTGSGVSYGIERSVLPTTNFSQIATTNNTTYIDSAVVNDTTFYYRVRQLNPNSGYSNIDSAIISGTVSAPTNLTATATSPSEIDLSWTSTGGAFEIQRSLTSGSGFVQVGSTTGGTTTFTDTSLTSDTTYYYRVREIGIVTSDWSNEASDTTLRIELVMTVDTTISGSTASNQFEIACVGTYDLDDGDGNIVTGLTDDYTITYTSGGTYTIKIYNQNTGFRLAFDNTGDDTKLTDISDWGLTEIDNPLNSGSSGSLYGCSNLDVSATNSPVLDGILYNAFRLCSSLVYNSSVGSWDMSSVTSTRHMFTDTTFNQDIGSWDMSSATTIEEMFLRNTAFNQDIGSWDISSVTTVRRTFDGAASFDQDISGWNFRNVTNYLDFLDGTAMSTANYDALLVALDADRANLASGITFGAQGLTYTSAGAGGTARASLIANNSWVFSGDSGV